ncbi:PAS domain S-box protein [Thiocystis violascens]|uniref:PAS domain S-box protein n=1 Tax=Thiocystis violascens TaxID=73141 RepID=UPI00145E231C|nr:PAS domain S-box protein [Thiocystis violascens]
MAETLDRESLLEAILDSALRLPELDGGGLYWREPNGSYRLAVKRGLSERFLAKVDRLAADSPQADIIRQGQLRCSCTSAQDPCADGALVREPELIEEGIHALVVLPIHAGGEPLACLNLASRRFGAVERSTVTTLETLARQFTLALERSLAQLAATGQRQNLEGLFEAITDYLFVLDSHGRILHYNAAVATLGYGDRLLGSPIWSIYPSETRNETRRLIAETLAGARASFALPLLTADGNQLMVDTRAVMGHWNGRPAIIEVSRDITAEQAMQEALREREEIYSLIFNQAGDGIELTDAETLRFVEVNDASCRLLGYTREELLGMTLFDIRADLDAASFREFATQVLATTGQIRFDGKHRRKDGALLDVQVSVQAVHLRGRDCFIGVWRDITSEKAAQVALANETEWRRALIEHSGDGIAIFEPAFGILEVNPRFAEMQGCAPQDLIGLHPWDFNADLSEADVRRDFSGHVPEINVTFETRHRRQDGTVYDAEVSLRGVEINGRQIVVSIARDISARKAQQRALEEREALLAAMFDQVGVGIDLLDLETLRFVKFNRTSHTLLGYSATEFSELRLPDILASPVEVFERVFQETNAELRSGKAVIREVKNRRRDGRVIDGLVNLRLIHLGGREHVLAVRNDITRQKAIEAELARRDEILAAVANLSLLFLRCSQWTEVMDDALGQLGVAARVSRAYLFERIVDADGCPRCRQCFEWCAVGVEPQISNPRDQNFAWQAHGLLNWYDTLSGGEPVSARRATYSAAERALLEPQGVHSILLVPLFTNGVFLGFLGFDDCEEEREWSLAEIAALRSSAGVICAAAEKAEVQRQLVERERRYTLATDAGKIGVWEWDLRTGQVLIDAVFNQSLGYSAVETVKSLDRWLDLVHPDDRKTAVAIRLGVEQHKIFTFDEVLRIASPDGRILSLAFRGSLMRDRAGRSVKVFGTAIDLTERYRMEDDLKRANEEWSKTFDTVPDAIAIMDKEGRLIKTNRAYAEQGAPWIEDLLHRLHFNRYDDTRPEGDLRKCSRNERVDVTEIAEDASAGLFRITTSRLYDDQGGLRSSVHVIHDITDRQRAEQARLARLEEQRDVLVREVHHRIKNHLQGLVGLLTQSLGEPRGGSSETIDKAIAQVKSIAAVYGLQSREAGADVCFMEMLEAILCNARALSAIPMVLSGGGTDMESLIARDKAVALALVINELLQNALKWSTLGSNSESVRVTCGDEDGSIRLTLTNPGVLSKDFDFGAGRGLGIGLELVRDMLPRQGAALTIDQTDGRVIAVLVVRPPLLVARKPLTVMNMTFGVKNK